MDLNSHVYMPITPESPLTSNQYPMELDSLWSVAMDCSPNTREKLTSQKDKASQALEKGPPTTAIPFLKWRLAIVKIMLEVKFLERKALDEAIDFFEKTGRSKTELMAEVMEDEKALRSEKAILLSQRKSFEGDLNDVDTSKIPLEAAYNTELRNSLEVASNMKQRVSDLKILRAWRRVVRLEKESLKLERKRSAKLVHKYLGTERNPINLTYRFCNVFGRWESLVRYAQIIPSSFPTKEMGHMFGSDEATLTSRRNGLSLHERIEEAFDNCWVAIVPLDSVACTPTEWKIVVLNPAVKDVVFHCESWNPLREGKWWRFRDIDGRKLTFRNDNRPARRFLFMRYILAWLHAEANNWEGFKEKLPPAEVWASPNKPDGYLRKSVLLELRKMTGDKLPQDLIRAGAFEDPATSSTVYDAVAGIRVAEAVQRHLDGERDSKQGEDSFESDEEQDTDDMGEDEGDEDEWGEDEKI